MTDRPIIFSGPMVRALLDGRKTQTRRLIRDMPEPPALDSVVHPNPKHERPYFDAYCGKHKTDANPRGMSDYWCWWTRDDREGQGVRIGYVPGDRLYVREACAIDGERAWFRLEHEEAAARGPRVDVRWRPSIHMPRSASRLTLIVEGVKVERLQAISEADAIAEGIAEHPCEGPYRGPGATYFAAAAGDGNARTTATAAYGALWESLHGAGSWDANPFVVALTFRVMPGNIDQVDA